MAFIRDIMSKIVVSVRPDATMMDAVKVLTKHHLSGAPVISSQGELIGFFSEPNLMDVLFDESTRRDKVSTHMTRGVHSVKPEDPISTAASLFTTYGVRRLPVVENDHLVGVVTRRDLLAHLLRNPDTIIEMPTELVPALAEQV